jgi:S-methylmethionine-dependent homocysteine/selenocysteine methylase
MSNHITILDGGMGRELARVGAPFKQPEWSALALYEAPPAVTQVHQDFINHGAEIITTNSYAVVPFHIGETRFQADSFTLAQLAGKLAKQAVENSGKSAKIAGSLPPLFGSYRFDLFQADKVQQVAQPLIDGLSPYVDFWLFETQSNSQEPLSVIPLLPKDNREIWVSFTLQDEEPTNIPQLRSGESVADAVKAVVEKGTKAVLFNCCQPEVIEQAIQVAKSVIGEQEIQIGAYANAFPPQPKDATANDGLDEIRQDLDPNAYLMWARKWVAAGATIVGGCCGITPAHIRVLAQNLN